MPKVSRLEVITTGSRRRWTLEEKQRIVEESCAVPRNASATARRHGLSNGQLFTWRRLAREGKLVLSGEVAGFVPAIVMRESPTAEQIGDCGHESLALPYGAEAASARRMEIVLANARRIIVGSDVDAAALARVIGVLERR
jgi:transposase